MAVPSPSDIHWMPRARMTTLVHALRQHGGRFGLQTMCEGGGTANVTVVERL